MKSRIPVGVLIAAALVLSLLPAAAATAQPSQAVATCDRAQFVADVTVPDGTSFAPGTPFTKTWRIKNIGTCTWTTSYALVFSSGEQMDGPALTSLPKRVSPGESVDLSVNLIAPNAAGHYIGFWKLKNASGSLFGLGAMNTAWFLDINVTSGPSATSVALDFAASVCSATWSSMQGSLPCPGTDGDPAGSVRMINQPALENGTNDPGVGLITMPQNVFNGDIHGAYSAFHVQSGDRFQSIVNCAFGATSCDVIFRLDYQIGSGPINTFWSLHEKYEGLFARANVDLSALAGQDVKFILTVLANGDAGGDRALWADPVITRTSTTPPAPNARNFDFGTATSPVAPGYVRVTEATAYAPGAYGWTTASGAQSLDRASQADPLKRDFVMSGTTAPTFRVDLPNGNYAVTVTMGDNEAPHDNMVVKANGMVMLPEVDTAAGAFAVNTFTVTVNSGSLTLQFLDAGGIDSTWVVNGVSIAASSQPPAACDRAQFVADLSVPDGTGFAPGQAFIKTWRLRNVGSCTWTTFYAMVFDTGEKMGGPDLVNLPQSVPPGQTVDLSVNLTAPASGGTYRGFWRFQNANGVRFGIGSGATQSWWVAIKVSGIPVTVMPTLGPTDVPTPTFPPPQGTCYRAQFISDVTVPDGTVFTPGTTFVKTWRLKNLGTCAWTTDYALVFENGDQMGGPNLVNLPQEVRPGTIADLSVTLTAPGTAGSYRGFWRLQNANGLRFGIGTAFIRTWWVAITVSGTAPAPTPTPTQVVTATASATPTRVPTLTPGPSPTPTFVPIGTDTTGWNTYLNDNNAFSFKFPPGSSTSGLSDTGGRINIPFAAGTNLSQKYLDLSVRQGVSPCKSPGTNPTVIASNVAFNGIQFLKETWTEGVTSHRADWTAYSTAKGNACISLSFLLWSVVPEVMETPPPRFDPAVESAVFTTILSTYQNR